MASKYLQKYPVPENFPDLLHDFAREVLRDQPANIYHYGYEYFKSIENVSSFFRWSAPFQLEWVDRLLNQM